MKSMFGFKTTTCFLICVGMVAASYAKENDNEKVVTFGEPIPAAKKRYDAYVTKVRRQITGKLKSAKFPKGESAKRDKSDHFVVTLLKAVPKTREVTAQFATYFGVEEGTENILEFLKATPNTEARDFVIMSRHADASAASTALANLRGRELEMANFVKTQVERREALRQQQLARARYIAAINAQRNRARARSRTFTSGRRGCSGGG